MPETLARGDTGVTPKPPARGDTHVTPDRWAVMCMCMVGEPPPLPKVHPGTTIVHKVRIPADEADDSRPAGRPKGARNKAKGNHDDTVRL